MEGQEGQQNEQSVAPEGQAAQVSGDPVSQETSYDIDGEKVPMSRIKEWKAGSMMQSDYTRKTMELSEQKKQLEPLIQAQQYLQQNPDKWERVQAVLNEGQVNNYIDPEVQKVAQENQFYVMTCI